jgi:hypothetical protein
MDMELMFGKMDENISAIRKMMCDIKGTVSFKNGERLEGVWTEGKLNGEVIKKDKHNRVTEKSFYENNIKIEDITEVEVY